MNIVIADDDPDILAIVQYRLERAGYTVTTTTDGQQAYDRIVELRPDLAVLDVMMPQLNGYEVTRKVRETDTVKNTPIILLTARVQETDLSRGYEAGADDYIRKPFSPQELLMRVQAALGRR